MNKERDIGKQNMRLTLVLWTVLCSVSMALMLWFSATKTIVIADAAQEDTESVSEPVFEKPVIQTRNVVLNNESGADGRFYVVLPEDVKAEHVTMENRYWDLELRIRIKCNPTDFYNTCTIAGDVSAIESSVCEMKADGILLRVKMKNLLEYRSTMEGKRLVLAYYNPRELYDMIVLLDPAGGGEQTGHVGTAVSLQTGEISGEIYEKDVTLQVARLVQKNLALDGVKVYLTRAEDVMITDERRLAFLEETKADFYIRLEANAHEESDRYGITGRYNGAYFMPDFGNVQLADVLTKEVTIATSNRAEGVYLIKEDSILNQIKVPAAEIVIGYFTNDTERELLGQAVYREKLAAGIINAITKVKEILTESGAGK